MERLPKQWAVRNDGSQDFKDSVMKYISERDDRHRGYFICEGGWCGKYHVGYFINYTDESMKSLKNVLPLPLHLFKQLVANESLITAKKSTTPSTGRIIGYTLKAGLTNKVALGALGITESSPSYRLTPPSLPMTFELDSALHVAATRAGVLDLLFEPVYKEKWSDVIVRHSTGHLVAHIENGHVTIDGQRFSTPDVERILAPVKVKGINFTPTTFTTGCNNQYEGIDRKDIKQVLDQMLPF